MENAGRQAVAAMEAAFDDLATSRSACSAAAATTAATASWWRGRWCSAASRRRLSARQRRGVRGDARTNLEILGRVGLTVVEITSAQEWELHFSEVSECDLTRS